MNSVIKRTGWAMLLVTAIGLALVVGLALLAGAFDAAPLIEVNGEPFVVAELGVGEAVMGIVGVLLALVVALVVISLVVPFAVLLPLLLAALLVGGALLVALLTVAGVLALMCSPLLVVVGVVWLIWRLVRGGGGGSSSSSSNAIAPKAGATIAG
jgi:hypothetical protein